MQESSERVPKEERCPGVCTAGVTKRILRLQTQGRTDSESCQRRPSPTQVPTAQEKPHLSLSDTRRGKLAHQTPPANVSQQGKRISSLAESCQLHPRVRILRTVSSWLLNIRTLDPLVLGHNAMPCPKVPTMYPAQINCREHLRQAS